MFIASLRDLSYGSPLADSSKEFRRLFLSILGGPHA